MREQRDFEAQELLADAAAGDAQARARLLHIYRGKLRRMIEARFNPRLVSRADPSDIVQEAMKDAYHRLPEYFADPQISFHPWLRRIAADRLVDAYRAHLAAERMLAAPARANDMRDKEFLKRHETLSRI